MEFQQPFGAKPGLRLRLLASCSLVAVSLAIAPATLRAAPTLTTSATYSLDGGASTTLSDGPSPTFVDILPSVGNSNSSIFGHSYAYEGGYFGSRSSGNGVYSIDSFARYQNTITNTTGIAAQFIGTFVIDNGEVGATMFSGATGFQKGAYSAEIKVNNAVVFTSSADITVTDGGLAVFTSAGTALNPGGESLSVGSGTYAWNPYTGTLDLGVLAPNETVEIDYRLTSLAIGSMTGCSTGDNGYGGYGYGGYVALNDAGLFCGNDNAIGRIGDPINIGAPGDTVGFAFESQVATPEPASMAILGAGLAGLAFMRKRRQTA